MNPSTGDILTTLFILLLLAGSVPAARWQLRRARRHESIRDQLIRLAHERASEARRADSALLNPGPAEQQAAVVVNSYALDNRALAKGFARLDEAMREHHTDQGDQK